MISPNLFLYANDAVVTDPREVAACAKISMPWCETYIRI
jgi:hypothetical protein